jgi:Circularly permutated YpsA SLOG family
VGVSRAVRDVATWIRCNHVETLNVAGPRASEDPEVYRATFALISGVLACAAQ